jgi:hypothetical protein
MSTPWTVSPALLWAAVSTSTYATAVIAKITTAQPSANSAPLAEQRSPSTSRIAEITATGFIEMRRRSTERRRALPRASDLPRRRRAPGGMEPRVRMSAGGSTSGRCVGWLYG